MEMKRNSEAVQSFSAAFNLAIAERRDPKYLDNLKVSVSLLYVLPTLP